MRIGIDLGGTKIEAIVLDKHGDSLWRQRVPTPSGNYPVVRCVWRLAQRIA